MISGSADPTAVIEGYVSTTGMGSESTARAARRALCDVLSLLPVIASGKDQHHFTLVDFANHLVTVFRSNLENDRVLLPLLETLAFLLDMRGLHPLTRTAFDFRPLFTLVRKAHFKSSNLQKLHLALDVYRSLADVEAMRKDVLEKVASMLLHPFPKIRVAAAETLFVVTDIEELKRQNWTASPKALKEAVETVREVMV